ncbi:unnamed protein product [Protopolystoma xenopodis]|uniref:Uncharacterized protein n=1 Tax=Protopolystoma xenopodis TaxID=117903 RepID=A0A3S5BSF1_9PLAT|nr:unnamed protein product [Protopolystoma xenopodis]
MATVRQGSLGRGLFLHTHKGAVFTHRQNRYLPALWSVSLTHPQTGMQFLPLAGHAGMVTGMCMQFARLSCRHKLLRGVLPSP